MTTSIPEYSPLILTLLLDSQTFQLFNQLRQQHFPPERNFLPAHLTLFHQLPGQYQSEIQQELQLQSAHTPVLPLTCARVRLLGRGVAVDVDCPPLIQMRQQLVRLWQPWLSRQDQQGYRPHITLQNKATPEVARQLYEQLSYEWQPYAGQGTGLLLWHYLGGPWELVQKFEFGSALQSAQPANRSQEISTQEKT